MEDIYDTLRGFRNYTAGVPGVENMFAPGSECSQLYGRVLDAYERLCIRLGVEEEDADVEEIIFTLMEIERAISFAMFRYGAQFGMDRQ